MPITEQDPDLTTAGMSAEERATRACSASYRAGSGCAQNVI